MNDISKVEQIFLAAVSQSDPNQRAEYLDGACGDDADLRRRVETLLAAQPHAEGFLEPVNPDKTHQFRPSDTHAIGAIIANRYTLVEVIGEGGMGTVWRARQTEPIKRYVALKLIKPGMDSKQVLARFEAERQALAMMDHPNIARILDGGIHDNRPFFVMELVKGTPITEFCDARKLTPGQRLDLFLPVCHAIQHAHQKGIIHRDIKPSNVLIALYDDKPVPKVIDFGVAKATGGVLTQQTIDTGFGSVVGTPQYMSPEQATFNNLDIDTRSDVYSLGTLLYELLAGSPPFAQPELEKRGLLEILRVVREEDPPRPSLKLSTAEARASISANRGSEPAQLSTMMQGEIDWIVMKALEKDRTRRYDTANALAKDVQRYLNGDAVEACPPTFAYRLRKAYHRNKTAVVVAAAFVGLLLGAAIMGATLALQAKRARIIAEGNRVEAEENAKKADSAKQQAVLAQQEADSQRDSALLTAYTASMNLASRAWEDDNVPVAQELLNSVPRSVGGRDIRGFEWQYLSRVCNSALLTLDGHSATVMCIELSADGSLIATGSSDRTVKVWSYATGQELFTTEPMGSGPVFGVAFSPDGQRVAGAGDPAVVIWDSHTGERQLVLKGHKHFVTRILFSPDGKQVATASYDGTVKVWDSTTGNELMSFDHSSELGHGGSLFALAFSPDGTRLASAGISRTIKIWSVVNKKEVLSLRGHANTIWSVAFSPDGKRLASGCSDESVKIWDSDAGNELLTIPSIIGEVNSVAYSPDGRRLAGGGERRPIKIWDANTGEELSSFKGHGGDVRYLTFSRNGDRLASASADGTARIWDSNQHNEPLTLEEFGPVAFSKTGRHVVTRGKQQNTIAVWDREGTEAPLVLSGHTEKVDRLAISSDGLYVASVSLGDEARKIVQEMKVWETSTGRELFSLGTDDREFEPEVFSFSPDSGQLITVSGKIVSAWELATGRRLSTLDTDSTDCWTLCFGPNGKQLATAHEFWGNRAVIWDSVSHTVQSRLEGHREIVSGLAYSPDGQRIATASFDKTVKVWDATKGLELFSIKGHTEPVWSVAYHPDGTRLATVSKDETVRIWDSSNGRELTSLKAQGSTAQSVIQFSPDGDCLILQQRDGRVCIWSRIAETPVWCR